MLKQLLIPLLIIITVVLVYMGVYLPVKKSTMYISTTGEARSFQSIQQLKESYNKVFEFNSPIGHEETVKFFLNSTVGTLSNDTDEATAKELVEFAESNMVEDNFLHILNIGNMYVTLWSKYGGDDYAQKAEHYYLKALDMGPSVPQPLHNLYVLYRDSGQQQKAEEIANKIIELWPEYEELASDNGLDI